MAFHEPDSSLTRFAASAVRPAETLKRPSPSQSSSDASHAPSPGLNGDSGLPVRSIAARRWSILSAVVESIDTHPALVVFAVALVLRIACLLWLGHVPYGKGGDAPRYLSIADDIVNLRGYGVTSRDTTRVPLYPLFVAAHLWLFGGTLSWIAVSQAAIDAATAVVITWTAAALGAESRGWTAGLLWATYPPAILNSIVIFPQPLQVFWLASAVWVMVSGIRKQSTWRCAAASVLWGAACLTRAGNLFFVPVFALTPFLCWRLRGRRTVRWASRTSLLMLACGAASVLWWTARDFPVTYRLQDLVLNQKERRAIALLLSPIQPIPDQVAAWLRHRKASAVDEEEPAILAAIPASDVQETVRTWTRQMQRTRTKLWQTFGAPDGCVQLGCSGPPGGYWAAVQSTAGRHPLRVITLATSEACLALKAMMYVEHYLLLALAVPGVVLLAKSAPGLTGFLILYIAYTVGAIVLGSNYSDTLAAVPRYAFSIMPIPVIAVGVLLSRTVSRTDRCNGRPTRRKATCTPVPVGQSAARVGA